MEQVYYLLFFFALVAGMFDYTRVWFAAILGMDVGHTSDLGSEDEDAVG